MWNLNRKKHNQVPQIQNQLFIIFEILAEMPFIDDDSCHDNEGENKE